MLDALSYDFMQQALAASLLASIACGVIGTLVVVNRLVFLAGGVSHAAYGGVGLAFHYGWPVLPSAIGFSVASSMLMAGVALKRPEKADTAIGVLWAAGMAFGIILIDLTPGYKADLMSFLFGSILAVPLTDLYLMAALDAALLAMVALCHQTLLVTSFDREFAEARGLPVRTAHYLVVGMTAVGVVMLIRVVGLVLVMALLTIPPFIAARSARSLPSMMAAATAWSTVFCVGGLALAYRWDVTSGAAIIAVASAGFMAVSGAGALRKAVARRSTL